jgi:hypothetical protein
VLSSGLGLDPPLIREYLFNTRTQGAFPRAGRPPFTLVPSSGPNAPFLLIVGGIREKGDVYSAARTRKFVEAIERERELITVEIRQTNVNADLFIYGTGRAMRPSSFTGGTFDPTPEWSPAVPSRDSPPRSPL